MNKPIYAYASYTHIFLATFFTVLTFINKDIRGIIWLAGAVFSSFLSHVAMNTIKPNQSGGADIEGVTESCYKVKRNYKLWNESHPALSSNIITFTLSYVLFPMLSVNKINPIVICGLVLLFIMDAYKKLSDNDTSCKILSSDIIIIGVIGFAIGFMWYKILKDTNNEKLFYFNEFLSNNEVCSKPSNTQFKCRVYKNGELIANI